MAEATALTDRDLDAWLAEHLFGFSRWEHFRDQAQTMPMTSWWIPQRKDYIERLPKWASTGDGMLLVIDALHARGFGVTVELHADEDSAEVLIWNGAVHPHARAHASTLPRAVAEAAMAAIQAEEAGA